MGMKWRAAAAADLGCVLLFVLLGRRSHGEGSALADTVTTAWPFLTGAAAGSLAVEAAKLPRTSWRAGVVVLVATVGIGMGLRKTVSGAGTPPSFLVVASSFLALFLLGWRALARRRATRKVEA